MSNKVTNLQILKRAAKKHGYQFGLIDSPYSEAIYVTNGEKHFISRSKTRYGMYPVNPKFAEHLVDDKAVTKRVLKKFGFRVIKGKLFYTKPPLTGGTILAKDRVSAAYAYAKKITYPVFVKPNNGSRGANARIIFTEQALKSHIKKMKEDCVPSFLIEKVTERPEYRIFAVGGKVQFMYRKKRVSVTGTGAHTIAELIAEMKIQPDAEYLGRVLKKTKQTHRSILGAEKELILQETANISLGAEITEYREKVPKAIDEWTMKLYKTTGLEVFGVDVFTKGTWDEPNKYLIIEVNSNPALSGIYAKGHRDHVYHIWGLIMKKFFKSS
jgi:D-alanine-D-alanine ligase-like ATP-grasp enzyme